MMESSNTESSKTGETKKVKNKSVNKNAQNAVAKDDVAVGALKLSQQEKSDIIKKFQINSQDVGSPEVQIALLTRRLEAMTEHFASHPKDFHSQRGMLNLISHRKSLLGYLRKEDVTRYRATIGALGLRK